MGQFEIVLILMAILAIASINFGYYLGYDKRNKELTNEIVDEFRKKFLQKFIEEFERRVNAAVEEETQRVHDELIELLEEENKKNEGIDSN
jgi:prephenate dehydrogenase